MNKGSGGNEGERVLALLKNTLGDENVYDIVAEEGPANVLQSRTSDTSSPINVIAAGGDGTFSWVADSVEKQNLSHVRLVVIPLGSGNDMSRALGWGKKFPGMTAIPKILDYIANSAPAQTLDVWRLSASEDPEKVQASPDDQKSPHDARPLMCNYLSLGADAHVELQFNQRRWDNPHKYKSRLGNFRAHLVVGAKYMMSPAKKKIYIANHIESLTVDDNPVEIPRNLQAIIFLNIPSYGAGTQPWGKIGSAQPADTDKARTVADMYVDDHQFEVIGLRSLPHFGRIKVFGAHGVRIAQGTTMHLKLKGDVTPFQVDGEPWLQRGGEVHVTPGNPVGVLQGASWRERSKKNAKFTSSVLDIDAMPEESEGVTTTEEQS